MINISLHLNDTLNLLYLSDGSSNMIKHFQELLSNPELELSKMSWRQSRHYEGARVRIWVVLESEKWLDEVFNIFAFAKDNSKCMDIA